MPHSTGLSYTNVFNKEEVNEEYPGKGKALFQVSTRKIYPGYTSDSSTIFSVSKFYI
jgi:hypothetical protein